MLVCVGVMVEHRLYHQKAAFILGQKYVRKRKGAVKMRVMVLKMCITWKQKCDRNVCELWIVECDLFRFQS